MMKHNPVIPGFHADPFVTRSGEDWYMVLTTELDGWDGAHFDIFHSRDLVHWSGPKEILNLKDLTWASRMAWAPTLLEQDGFWYFCFAAEQRIGIAVCGEPMGTYRDLLGRPLIEKDYLGTQSIDPSLFRDTDGRTWLFWGSGNLWLQEIVLSPADARLIGEPRCLSNDFYWQRSGGRERGYDPSIFCEGADCTYYRGRYLLTWSIYDTRDPRYAMRYAWAEKVTGPYIQPLDEHNDNLYVQGRGSVQGTGHGNSVVRDDELIVFYHRRADPMRSYAREVCCDNVSHLDEWHLKTLLTE